MTKIQILKVKKFLKQVKKQSLDTVKDLIDAKACVNWGRLNYKSICKQNLRQDYYDKKLVALHTEQVYSAIAD